jgi:hypothetical protein
LNEGVKNPKLRVNPMKNIDRAWALEAGAGGRLPKPLKVGRVALRTPGLTAGDAISLTPGATRPTCFAIALFGQDLGPSVLS